MMSWLSRRKKVSIQYIWSQANSSNIMVWQVSSFKSYLRMTMEDEDEEFAHSRFQDQHIVLAKYPARQN